MSDGIERNFASEGGNLCGKLIVPFLADTFQDFLNKEWLRSSGSHGAFFGGVAAEITVAKMKPKL